MPAPGDAFMTLTRQVASHHGAVPVGRDPPLEYHRDQL